MSGVLVYSERESVALELLTFASTLERPVAVALVGQEAAAWAKNCFSYGAQRAFTSADPALTGLQADVLAEALAQITQQADADVILIGSTLRGREAASRLAQKLNAGCITDANGLRFEDGRLVATRYALGGNTIATQVVKSSVQVIAVMPQTIQAAPTGNGGSAEVVEARLSLAPSPVKTVERRPKQAGSVNVESAEVIVCIGRGVGEQSDLEMIQALADALGGVVGCTRPVSHDKHWLSEDQMIGISGKMSSPRLYVGVGLSGQIQHTVGIMGSKVTVAINNDKNAPIFKMADYGIVGDLYQVVPKLTEKLKTR
jgi:electron transfer flavoprotein alpha subunit